MLKQQISIFRKLNLSFDLLMSAFAFAAAVVLTVHTLGRPLNINRLFLRYHNLFFSVIVLWPLLLYMNGLYPTNRFRPLSKAVVIIVKASLQGMILVLAVIFTFRIKSIPREFMYYFTAINTMFLIIKEVLIVFFVRFVRKLGGNFKNAVIVSDADTAPLIAREIEQQAFLGIGVTGIVVPQEERALVSEKEKIIGTIDDIENILNIHPIDIVIINTRSAADKKLEDIFFLCEERGIEIWVVPHIFQKRISVFDVDDLAGMPMFVFRSGPPVCPQLLIKYIVFDRILAFFLFILSIPLIILIGAVIKLTSKGPVIFKQERCTRYGTRFVLYKLRTMCFGADKLKKELAQKNIMQGPVFKIKQDPRLTPFGRLLRKTSLDELPQFWNVLKGDMSLVGPRPPLPDELQHYRGWQRRRLSMRAGITGLWQVYGRNRVFDFDQLSKMDLKYIDTWSLWLDIRIILRTIIEIIKCSGY